MRNRSPLISVVIPCFNARPWIRHTLESVRRQELSDLEVVLIDDGSTDGCGAFAAQEFPEIYMVRIDRSGPSRARNLGTRLSRGEFIQYLDADDLLAPGKLAEQYQCLMTTGAEVAYGDWLELATTIHGQTQPGRRVRARIEGDPQIALFTDFWCPPAAYLFRRQIVEQTGGWNENLPVIQDARFVLDCALYGARFAYCPGLAAYYRVHQSGSVSTANLPGFLRDRLRNGIEVEAWWRQHAGLTRERTAALLRVYGNVARTSFEEDPPTFEAAYAALQRLDPNYAPGPRSLAIAARVVGYRRAEAIASRYRRMKQRIHAFAG